MDRTLYKLLNKKKSWQAISREIKGINKDNPVVAGKLFEHLCLYYYKYFYNGEFQHVWLFEDIPFNVRKQLGLSDVDYGVDLLIQTNEKRYLAVQCKFRDDENAKISWSKDKLANLFAEGSKCDHYIIFTNAAGIDEHSIAKYRRKLTVVTYDVLQDSLTDEAISKVSYFIKTKQIHHKCRFSPLPHQNKAIKDIIKGFERNDRGKLVLPCGAGKTLVALWVKEKLDVKNTLVLVPSLALLRQFYESWKEQQKEYADYLCVCSESDIDKSSDTNVSHTYEIQAPDRVTTDSDVIRSFLKKSGPRIIYSTYQSSPQIAKALEQSGLSIDLTICDEAHKTAGERRVSAFASILDDRKIPSKKRLFMTATPRVVSAVIKNKLGDNTYKFLADMNDPDTYGPEFHRMSFADAINQGILVDYKIIAVGITDKELQGFIHERRFVEDATIEDVANNYALSKAMRNYEARHAVSFHSSVRSAKRFKERHEKLFRHINCYHINGDKTTKERKRILDDFKRSEKALVTNARCLTEGVDVPAIDVVYFCDPKYSKIDIVQAAGRALRQDKEKDKKFGYIIIPVYHAKSAELQDHVEKGAFSQLVRVVRAMADQDERIEEEISEVVYGEGVRKTAQKHIRIDAGKVKLININGFANKLGESIFFDVIRKTVIPYRPYQKAREYVHSLKLSSQAEWISYCRNELPGKLPKPDDIPANPYLAYKDLGWKSMGDWLGSGRVAYQLRKCRAFEDARKYVHSLRLRSRAEWGKYCRGEIRKNVSKPVDIPVHPEYVYRDQGWKGMGDWLGTGTVASFEIKYRAYEKAKMFVRKLKLGTVDEWRAYCKGRLKNYAQKPSDIPAKPYRTYLQRGWKNWGEWLGTGRVANILKKYRPYRQAQKYVKKLGLKSVVEWNNFCKGKMKNKGRKPDDIPANQCMVYKNKGWNSWGLWLGTGRVANQLIQFREFRNARSFVRKLKLKSRSEWYEYCKGRIKNKPPKPLDIPIYPDDVYKKKGWRGVSDWLGVKVN